MFANISASELSQHRQLVMGLVQSQASCKFKGLVIHMDGNNSFFVPHLKTDNHCFVKIQSLAGEFYANRDLLLWHYQSVSYVYILNSVFVRLFIENVTTLVIV